MSGRTISIKCKCCSGSFEAKLIKLRQGKGKFCSAECYNHFRKANKTDKKIQEKKDQIKHKYGLSMEEFEQMKIGQENKCSICKKTFVTTPHIDHCHKTSRVRGLLCLKCNRGIGMLNDDIGNLERAISYLLSSNG